MTTTPDLYETSEDGTHGGAKTVTVRQLDDGYLLVTITECVLDSTTEISAALHPEQAMLLGSDLLLAADTEPDDQ